MTDMAVLRVTEDGWHMLDPQTGWQTLEASPRLSMATVVVLDFETSVTDVWRFDGKVEHARALIEKRVRTEGLVDGLAHVVVHRLQRYAGGFQAYFSAFSLEQWQQVSAWAQAQQDHCLLVHAAAVLCADLPAGQGRVLLSGRGMSVFLNGRSGMLYASVRSMDGDVMRLPGLARTLGLQVLPSVDLLQVDQVGVGTGAVDREVPMHDVMEAFSASSGLRARWLTPETAGVTGGQQTVLPSLAVRAVDHHVLNPGLARMAWLAESWLGRLTVLVALIAVGLVGVGGYAHTQTRQLVAKDAAVQNELSALEKRVQKVGQLAPEPALLTVAEFARKLDEGVRQDPLHLLADLRKLTPPSIRIQQVKLSAVGQQGKVFQINGWAEIGESTAVVHWVSSMGRVGWRFKAVDPVEGMAGAFAYEVLWSKTGAGKDNT
ncbi:PilN domain-containing protein [Hydrogenophaga soli]